MRKLLLSLALVLGITTSATADITFVFPQKPGAGTTVWTEIVAKELEIRKEQSHYLARQFDYPSMGDQLDDLYKQGLFSTEMTAKIKKVKDDNPKMT